MSTLERLEERLDLLDGNLTVGSPAEENLAELASIVRAMLDVVKTDDRVLRSHLNDVV